MSTKEMRVGMISFEPAIGGQLLHARIRHGHFAGVRLDGAERIVGRLRRRRLGQRVEEGGLADIRQADDTAFEAHGFPCSLGMIFAQPMGKGVRSSGAGLRAMMTVVRLEFPAGVRAYLDDGSGR